MATRNDFYKFRLDIQELNQKTEQYKILVIQTFAFKKLEAEHGRV